MDIDPYFSLLDAGSTKKDVDMPKKHEFAQKSMYQKTAKMA